MRLKKNLFIKIEYTYFLDIFANTSVINAKILKIVLKFKVFALISYLLIILLIYIMRLNDNFFTKTKISLYFLTKIMKKMIILI